MKYSSLPLMAGAMFGTAAAKTSLAEPMWASLFLFGVIVLLIGAAFEFNSK